MENRPSTVGVTWRTVIVGIAAFILIALAACSSAPSDTNLTTAPAPTSQADAQGGASAAPVAPEEPPASPPVKQPAPIKLQGKGKKATQRFQLEEGLVVIEMSHKGSENFIIHLLSADGNGDEGLANAIGKYSGSRALGVGGGKYLFNVEADGPWTITVNQPRAGKVPPATRSFAGKGPKGTNLFTLSSGLKTVTLSHSGSENFIVHLLDENGNDVESLANEIGKFEGSQALNIDQDGIYILDVEADGAWRVSIHD